MSSLVRLLNRIKLHRDVFGVYSKVDILYYSQNREDRRTTLVAHSRTNDSYDPASIPKSTQLNSYRGCHRVCYLRPKTREGDRRGSAADNDWPFDSCRFASL